MGKVVITLKDDIASLVYTFIDGNKKSEAISYLLKKAIEDEEFIEKYIKNKKSEFLIVKKNLSFNVSNKEDNKINNNLSTEVTSKEDIQQDNKNIQDNIQEMF